MCGICGIVSYNKKPIEESLLWKMCRTFSYRGPDNEGIYIRPQGEKKNREIFVGLGHKRLSIIDLSPAGHQPLHNEDRTIWITYNGEIYNFKDLRVDLVKKGHVFKSETDTEVVVHQYEEEGIRAVKRFNGMFSFALWDEKSSKLWLCRDRLGIKPLVYYWDGSHFAFASEIKALLCDPVIPKELDYEALLFYLAFNYIPAPYTIFKGIRKLEPGHYLVLEKGKLTHHKYWDVSRTPDPEYFSMPFEAQTEHYKKVLYDFLSDAVTKRMISDVPLGAFLSGGIDSSIIVALMALHSSDPVQTFSIGFKDVKLYDETRYARDVVKRYGTDHHEFKLVSSDMLDIFSDVLSTFDEPFAGSSAIPTYIVSRETRKHVTVALSGDGGDELFAGYRSYKGEYWYPKYMMIPALLREGLIEKAIQYLPDSRDTKVTEFIRRLKKFVRGTKGSFAERFLSLKEVFPRSIRESILVPYQKRKDCRIEDPALKWVLQFLNFYQGDGINRILYADLKDSLPAEELNRVDWMSMKNSLEVRVPFLDHRVVELVFQMQGSLKLHRGKAKFILIEAFKDLLPKSLYNRSKAGFEVPISHWLKTDLKFLLSQFLDKKRINDQGIFDYKIIEKLLHDHVSNKTDTSWMLWNLIVFQYWYENYY